MRATMATLVGASKLTNGTVSGFPRRSSVIGLVPRIVLYGAFLGFPERVHLPVHLGPTLSERHAARPPAATQQGPCQPSSSEVAVVPHGHNFASDDPAPIR